MMYACLLALIGAGLAAAEPKDILPFIPNFNVIPSEILGAKADTVGQPMACQTNAWNTCNAQYLQMLGLPQYPTASDFISAISGIYRLLGEPGFVKVCNAQRELYTCLGSVQYAACTSALHYISAGMSVNDAYSYQTFWAQEHFNCGGGYMGVLYNWKCIYQTTALANQTLQACHNSYENNIIKNPQNACQLNSVFEQCYGTVFNKCNAQTGWVMCETIRTGIDANFPACNNRCYVHPASNPQEKKSIEAEVAEAAAKEKEETSS